MSRVSLYTTSRISTLALKFVVAYIHNTRFGHSYEYCNYRRGEEIVLHTPFVLICDARIVMNVYVLKTAFISKESGAITLFNNRTLPDTY
jgi:hypothetical protein